MLVLLHCFVVGVIGLTRRVAANLIKLSWRTSCLGWVRVDTASLFLLVVDLNSRLSIHVQMRVILSDGRESFGNQSGSIVLVEKCALKHDNYALVHVHSCLLNGFQEPDLGSLEGQ